MDMDMDVGMDSGMSHREMVANEIPDKRKKLKEWTERYHVLSSKYKEADEEFQYYDQLKENHKSMCDDNDPASARELRKYNDELKRIQDRLDNLYKDLLEARDEVDFLEAELKEMEEDAKG